MDEKKRSLRIQRMYISPYVKHTEPAFAIISFSFDFFIWALIALIEGDSRVHWFQIHPSSPEIFL